ncbi:hypothetical protein BTVI_09391 [Pitangus sulphuratus]|nr:hypothetical protein BTVI_09391 [Pitangus sulphuratus]
MSSQCVQVAKEGQWHPGLYQQQCGKQKRIVSLYSALVRPHFKSCVQFCTPQFKKDIEVLEGIQGRAVDLVKRLEGKSYEKQLRELGLFELKKRRFRGDLIIPYNYLKGECSHMEVSLFYQDRTRGHSLNCTRGGLSPTALLTEDEGIHTKEKLMFLPLSWRSSWCLDQMDAEAADIQQML